MISDLATGRPRFVVLDAGSTVNELNEPNGSALSSGVTLLDAFIAAHYRPIQTFGFITVLRIKEGEVVTGPSVPSVSGLFLLETAGDEPPLAVDLDGTLIKADILHEGIISGESLPHSASGSIAA